MPEPADSLIAHSPCAALLIEPGQDRIRAANMLAVKLLKEDPCGRPFAGYLRRRVPDLIVFADAVAHYGQHWTRGLDLHDATGAPLRVEVRGRLMTEGAETLLLLVLIDLEEMEAHTQIAEAASIQSAGILEWQRTQAFFRELEMENQLILNAAGEGIYGVNAEGKTTFVNRAAQEMLGWTSEDLLGRDIHTMIHHHHLNGDVYPSRECPIYQSFRYEQVNRIENEVFWRKDGKPIQVEYVSTPIYDNQVLAGAVVIFRDITERKENERRLREALDEVAALRDRLEQENAYLQEEIITERAHHDIIGAAPAIRQLRTQIDLVARTDANVLITGESGTGKSLVASAVHKASDRRRRALIRVKCGALSPDGVESELFGHVRGAFTGALRDRPGMLELAHGGTLFLDEVAEIPLEHQGRLLTALQERAVVRIGEERPRAVDLRIIASSSRNLEREVSAGRFREDLYFFLAVFPIACTPLRERPEDIPQLAAHFLKLACGRLNRTEPVITQGTIRSLMQYHWPGNVRELENVIERGAIVSTGGKLVVDVQGPAVPAQGTAGPATILTDQDLRQLEVANLISCLRETGGKVFGPDGAAAILGVRPTTLYSRIRKYGIESRDWGGV
ncbi:sigma 54-interacting transcriptional regulator [Halovulum dunhuangense]|uniref:Nif-specific regulatory protein n=1 Tax=Halovulum dunhuangense TaxID=1505036 RepID=A0A849L5T3_9RHOB|nr:sigma 54-interacting transcriptional regulator [Halovulum dunhuangense]NNU81755.1 sigma 54-interacting transcriptional regulator [Halovulum dunhuangense]